MWPEHEQTAGSNQNQVDLCNDPEPAPDAHWAAQITADNYTELLTDDT